MLFVGQSCAYILLQCATLSAIFNGRWDIVRKTELGCLANNYVPTYSCACIHINMFLIIAIERWISIFKPLHYVNYVTKCRIGIAVAMAYIAGIANGCLMLVWNSVEEHKTNGMIPWEMIQDCRVRYYVLRGDYLLYFHLYSSILSGVIAGLYIHTLLLARKHTRQIHNLVVHLPPTEYTTQKDDNRTTSGNRHRAIPVNTNIYRKAKGTIVLFVLICFYIISRIPSKIYLLFQYDFGEFTLYTFDYVSMTGYVTSVFISFSFDLMQPFIYMFGQADIRKIIKQKIFRCCKSNRIENLSTSDQNLPP